MAVLNIRLAPEQARGKAVFASDIYGLGVTCIYLLTQVSPFDLFSDSEFQWVWRQYLNGIRVNDKLGRILDKMLEQALERRYKTLEDVLQDLDLPKKSPISTSVRSLQTPVLTPSSSIVLNCGDGVKLELVKVAAGSFDMGSNKYDNEKSIHRVSLCDFFIGKYPITQMQYQAVMGNYPSYFKNTQNPVENVTWHDAMEFCLKLSKRIGQKVRLPSEAEWEYAAKGGNQSRAYEYSGSNNLDEVGWYSGNSSNKTHPVGQKKANEIGIYDMSGNVWEWCLDDWHDSYKAKPDHLKHNGHEPWGKMNLNRNDNRYHLLRGGSWRNIQFVRYCRSANRGGILPSDQNSRIGFRVSFVS